MRADRTHIHHLGDRLALRDQRLNTHADLLLLLVEAFLRHVCRTVDESTICDRPERRTLDELVGQADHADACEDDEEQPAQDAEESNQADDEGNVDREHVRDGAHCIGGLQLIHRKDGLVVDNTGLFD